MEKYQIIREIGNGSFAKVLLARCKLTYRVFAIKKMVKQLIKRTNTVKNVMMEREILKDLDHPFIVKLYESFQD